MVRISAIVTSWNRKPDLIRAVESAVRQTHPDIEVIVVDNCSDFDVAAVLTRFGEKIRLIRNPANYRVAAARNIGVAASTGEFVAFLDDDDIWLPHKLERQLAAIGDAVMCLCGMNFIPGGGANLRRHVRIEPSMLSRGNPICGPSGFFCRRDLFDRMEFDPDLRYAEDWDFLIRALQHGAIAYCPEILFDYRVAPTAQAMTTAARRLSWSEMQYVFDAADKHRSFMGEGNYRRRLAKLTLVHLAGRPDKLAFIGHSVGKAGIVATGLALTDALRFKLTSRLQRQLRRPVTERSTSQ